MARPKKVPTAPPRTRTTRYRALWEESVEREKGWQQKLEETTAYLSEQIKRGDQLSHDLVEARGDIIGFRLEADRAGLERDHLRRAFDALLQRYVGVKLDCQQLNFAQAQKLCSNEWAALEEELSLIRKRPQSMQFAVSRRDEEAA